MREDLQPLNLYDRYCLLLTSLDMFYDELWEIRCGLVDAYIEDGEDPESFECATQIDDVVESVRRATAPDLLHNMTWDGDAELLVDMMELDRTF